MELSDGQLVARVVVDDDQHAFAELVRRNQSTVRGLLRQLTRTDMALADDLAQETFIRAYKNIRSFRGDARFSTWLYRIAYNCFREDARKRKELVGIDEERSIYYHCPSARPWCFAAKTGCHTMKPRASSTSRSARSRRMCCAAGKN